MGLDIVRFSCALYLTQAIKPAGDNRMKATFLILTALLFAAPAMAADTPNPNCNTNWKNGACGLTDMSPGTSYGGGPVVTAVAPPKEDDCPYEK